MCIGWARRRWREAILLLSRTHKRAALRAGGKAQVSSARCCSAPLAPLRVRRLLLGESSHEIRGNYALASGAIQESRSTPNDRARLPLRNASIDVGMAGADDSRDDRPRSNSGMTSPTSRLSTVTVMAGACMGLAFARRDRTASPRKVELLL
jgi:hypothetical protein